MSSLPYQTEIESVAQTLPSAQQEDFRTLVRAVLANLVALSPGGNLVAAGGAVAGSNAAPGNLQVAVAGANGQYTVTITRPKASAGKTIWYEISYAQQKSFTSGVVTLAPTTGTIVPLALPGASLFFRARASYDLVTWSAYRLASNAAIASGKLSSGAASDGLALNQTNYGVVSSTAVGATAEVSIAGASGPRTGLVTQRGPTQKTLPSSTIYGAAPGSNLFVVWDGSSYVLRNTLAGALADDGFTPIGAVGVVETGAPTLPAIAPIVSGGGVIGYNVTNQGNGISAPLTLTVVGTGAGATTGAQTIENGKLVSVAPGNAGAGYASGSTTVTVSGGVNPGTTGGGTALGGNGGRMTAV